MTPAPISDVFQSLDRDSGCSDGCVGEEVRRGHCVSIPRSGFWLFGLQAWQACPTPGLGFNPSIGILVVRTLSMPPMIFSSSDVSIPRSGFWLFGPQKARWDADGRGVSIPRSGFWLFGPDCAPAPPAGRGGFNPSIGILVVRTDVASAWVYALFPFQSLDRDSGCSDWRVYLRYGYTYMVSIPRSGFWLFGPGWSRGAV